MGTLNWTLTSYAADDNKNIRSSTVISSAASTTSTTADNISGLNARVGQVFTAVASEPMWINFGGNAAAVGTGHYISNTFPLEVEISKDGAVSVIDAA